MTARRLLAGTTLFVVGLLGVALPMSGARDHSALVGAVFWIIPLPLTVAGFVVLWPRRGDGEGGLAMQAGRWAAIALGISVGVLAVSVVTLSLVVTLLLRSQ